MTVLAELSPEYKRAYAAQVSRQIELSLWFANCVELVNECVEFYAREFAILAEVDRARYDELQTIVAERRAEFGE